MIKPYYQNNGIAIYNSDSESIIKQLTLPIDLILTDPPYGIAYRNNYTNDKHDILTNDQVQFPYKTWAKDGFGVLKNNACVFAYTRWDVYGDHFRDVREAGFTIKEPLIIQKGTGGMGDLHGSFKSNSDWIIFGTKGRFKFQQTELLRNKKAGLISGRGRKPTNEFKTRFPSCWFGEEFPWSSENPITKTKRTYKHPTIKNIKAMEWLILLSTAPGEIILDPFMGTGTTLLAAVKQGRGAIGIEIEQKFCDMTIDRLETYFQQTDKIVYHKDCG